MDSWPVGKKAVIVGCGAAGTRIAQLLRDDFAVDARSMLGVDVFPNRRLEGWPDGVDIAPAIPADVPDAVWFVCTPAATRNDVYRAIFRTRPTAIFAEKPLGTLWERSPNVSYHHDALISEASEFGIPLALGYCWRWHPGVLAAHEWLRGEDASARAESVTATLVCTCDMRTWPGEGARTGAPLTELSHELDVALSLFGPGQIAYARRLSGRGFVAVIEHCTGATTFVELRGDSIDYKRSIELRSRADSFRWRTSHPGSVGKASVDFAAPEWTPAEMYRAMLNDFVDSVRRLGTPRVSWADGAIVLDWCYAIHDAAARTKR